MRFLAIFFITMLVGHIALATPINIIAAENFYGQLAKEIGGNNVNVNSIISNPNADPHLFAITASTTKQIQDAQIIIYNGANYDAWMEQILKSQKNLVVINVAKLMQLDRPGVNPHLWYKPDTMPALAFYLAKLLIKIDPSHESKYKENLAKFLKDNQRVQAVIAELKAKYTSLSVTATEPVFNYMTDAIGLHMQGLDVQWKIMNDTEPSPKMLSDFLDLLNKHKVRLLFYNNQVTEGITQNILTQAQKNNIQVVGINETMPPDLEINTWLLNQLNHTKLALQTGNK
ncbi:MAG: cation transporter substrate-binding protein [Burkholderiales bacterium]|jgi:zinc/manganese transport system substrate-binding protein|nr:cation transporter substrate-binding protein [Burkholderiales bacterium]